MVTKIQLNLPYSSTTVKRGVGQLTDMASLTNPISFPVKFGVPHLCNRKITFVQGLLSVVSIVSVASIVSQSQYILF
jgi:hypothetical protein